MNATLDRLERAELAAQEARERALAEGECNGDPGSAVWHLDNGRDGEIYAKRDPGPSGDRDGGREAKNSHLQGRGAFL